mgnify:CR=1 FL=1
MTYQPGRQIYTGGKNGKPHCIGYAVDIPGVEGKIFIEVPLNHFVTRDNRRDTSTHDKRRFPKDMPPLPNDPRYLALKAREAELEERVLGGLGIL